MKTILLASLFTQLIFQFSFAIADDKPLSGQAKIDSLLSELPKAKGDTNEVVLLINLSKETFKRDKTKGIEYSIKSNELAKRINFESGIFESYSLTAIQYFKSNQLQKSINIYLDLIKKLEKDKNKKQLARHYGNLGASYLNNSDYKLALKYQNKSYEIYKEINDSVGLATNLINICVIQSRLGDFPLSLEYGLKSLEMFEQLNDSNKIAHSLGMLGVLYRNMNNDKKALEHYKMAFKINQHLKNELQMAENLANIGGIYKSKRKFDSALNNYLDAIEILEKLEYKPYLAMQHGNIGNLYADLKDYSKSLEYYNKALELNREINRKSGIANNLGGKGEVYYLLAIDTSIDNRSQELSRKYLNKESNLIKSIDYLESAIDILNEIGEISTASMFYEILHLAYEKQGNYKKSLYSLRKHKEFNDSLFKQENADKIAALEKAREDDLKQKEIEKQKIQIAEQEKREQLILYFSIGFIIVMAIVMFIIYRLLKRSDKLLYNVLPVSIAKRLKNKEHPISDYFTQASIVFIDIVNFTEMAKDEDPRRVVESLNKIFTHYDTIANKYGLEKIKTIGDSYMAAAGIPEVQKDNTHRAAQMALEVKQLMSDYRTADGTKIEVRIGLDCGPVVAGVIGENKFIYDMWSDAVNTASRMESTSESGQVHITDRFREAVSEYEEFEYVERGEIEIKGKGMMKTYYIESKEVESV